MSFQLYGDNRKENIEADVPYEEGDFLIADPGKDECSSRMFFLRETNNPIESGGGLEKPYQLDKVPSFGNNKYAFPFISCMNYYVEEVAEIAYQDELLITHKPDPSKQRYVECWVIYYPATSFSPILDEANSTHLAAGSNFFMKNPRYYPDLIQSISIPGNDTNWLPQYDTITDTHIRLDNNATIMVLWGDLRAAIYEWNSGTTEYDLAYDFNVATCTQIHSVGLSDDWVVVAYDDSGETEIQWAYIEKSGTWSITGTYDKPTDAQYSSPIHLYEDTNDVLILNGCNYNLARAFDKDTRTLQYKASDLSPLWIGTSYHFWPYAAYANEVKTWGRDQWSYGGPLHWYPSYSRFRGSYAAVSYDSGYGEYLRDNDGNSQPADNFLMYHYDGDIRHMMINISVDPYQLIMYPQYIDAYNNENLLGFVYASYLSICVDNVFINFKHLPDNTAKVYWAPNNTEVVALEDFTSINKPYNGCFYPVKYPYFISNHGDNTLKVTEINRHQTETIGDGILEISTYNEISTTADFDFPTEPTNTTTLFRLSWDKVTWYKWNGSTWVTEASAANGCTLAQMTAGCQAGLIPPANTYNAYIGIYVTCSADDADYKINYSEVKLWLTTVSSANDRYMTDDSMVEIEFVSDTQTKITSKIQQNIVLSAQVCLIAPPYDEQYED